MKKLFWGLIAFIGLFICGCSENGMDDTPTFEFKKNLDLTPEIDPTGGTLTFDFVSQLDWAARVSDAWLSVVPESGTADDRNITVTLQSNKTGETRIGAVTITLSNGECHEISVSQESSDVVFAESGNPYKIGYEGGDIVIPISTNADYTVEIPEEAKEWLTVADTRALREEKLTFTAAKNEDSEARCAEVKLLGAEGEILQTFTIEQACMSIFDIDAENLYKIDIEGGTIEVNITTNLDYTVEIPEEAKAWLTVADTRALREETLTFTVTKNESYDVRRAVVRLLGADGEPLQVFAIEQSCEDIFESEKEAEYTVDAKGGTIEVKIATNLDYRVEIPEEAQVWLRLADTRAYREETLTFVVLENEEYSPRSAVVRLWDADGLPLDKFIVAQTAKTGDPNQIIYTSAGGVVAPTTAVGFGASIVSNVYEKGVGIITFTGDINAIPDGAFKDAKMLTGITLPETVLSIGAEAFSGCEALPIFKIPESVTTIGEKAFYQCASLKEITVPEGVASIGSATFFRCTSLASVTISDSVTSIGGSAFSGCSSLTSITIPDSVTSIGGCAFYECSSLASVKIGSGVTDIGFTAFYNCSSLTSVIIPDNVISIGETAFDDCTSLTSVTIGSGVTSIGRDAFRYVTGELIINSKIVETNYNSSNCPTYYKDSFTSGWLYGSKFTKLTIGDNITKIGDYAFKNCTSLTNVTIPDGVTSIGDSAFYGCTSLEKVTIGNSVTEIGNYAFGNCDSLTRVDYQGDLSQWIAIDHYIAMHSLLHINGSPVIFEGDFVIPEGTKKIGYQAFFARTSLTSITIPDSVTSIGHYAFWNCSGLTSVTIPDSVTSIGVQAFVSCSGLISITIPDSVTSIGGCAFDGCNGLTAFYGKFASEDNRCLIVDGVLNSFAPSGLTTYSIPDSVTSIGAYAFDGCSSLTSVTIPKGVTSIGISAFIGCSGLTSVYISDLSAWCKIKFDILSGSGGMLVGTNPLEYAGNLYLNGVLVTNIVIPSDITCINDGAFLRCTSLTSVTIPDSVTSIGNYAFADCISLKSITIGNGVTSIGIQAFVDCRSLTSVTIPQSVTSIGYAAFANCSKLNSFYCKPITPPTGGDLMFSHYNNGSFTPIGCKIYVPTASVSAYKAASYWSDYASYIVGYNF